MASWYSCPRGCGKELRKGDKMMQYLHSMNCRKQLWNGGKVAGR